MNSSQLKDYEQKLLNERERLRGDIDSRTDRVPEQMKTGGDLSDDPSHPGDRDVEGIDVEAETGDVQSQELRQVKDALDRIDAGTFGECVECGEPIQKDRLDAMPYTPYCVECERKVEAGAIPIDEKNDGR